MSINIIDAMSNAITLPEKRYSAESIRAMAVLAKRTVISSREFEYDPFNLSLSLYGTKKYWYILMVINGYEFITDFHSFSTLLVPPIIKL